MLLENTLFETSSYVTAWLSPGISFEFEHVNFTCPNTPCMYISWKHRKLGGELSEDGWGNAVTPQ